MYNTLHFHKDEGSLFDQILASLKSEYGKIGFCGGRGACGKCRVRFPADAPLPSFADRRYFSPQQLREGYRLACTAKPVSDCEVEICFSGEPETAILTVSDMAQEGFGEEGLFCAIDLGTTTVVMQLVDKKRGDILFSYAFQNPQRAYGVDVLARISAAENGKAGLLRDMVLTELENGFAQMKKAGEPEEIIISGNTTMGHLLLGYPAESLGKAPFTPYHIGSTEFDLCGHPAVFLPGISAFVGADIVSGIYACRMAEKEELSLFIDLGTNGEMAIGNKERIICTATAAGSAFEGGVSARVMGTDMTALAFDMLGRGIMDETGLMEEPWFSEGYKTDSLLIRQQDIRNLQMAKAAICAGASLLLDKTDGWGRLAHVYLAGGFGYYLNVAKAVGIGLIPASLQGICSASGNTSLAGAIRYGRNSADGREEMLQHIVKISQPLNLAEQPEFETRYIDAMAFRRIWPA